MMMGDNSKLKEQVRSWERQLSNIIVNWDLIPGSPKDEFDSLTQKLIGHLTKGTNNAKLYDILESELIIRYGLSPGISELEQFAKEVIEWWGCEKQNEY